MKKYKIDLDNGYKGYFKKLEKQNPETKQLKESVDIKKLIKRGKKYLSIALDTNWLLRRSRPVAKQLINTDNWTKDDLETAYILITDSLKAFKTIKDTVIKDISLVQTYLNNYWNISESKKIQEAVDNEEVAEIIAKLRDSKFSNEDMRKELLNLLTTLMIYKDPNARKVFKMVGNALTEIGDSLLSDNENENEYETDIEINMDEDDEIEISNEYEEEKEIQKPLVTYRNRENVDKKTNSMQILKENRPEYLHSKYLKNFSYDLNRIMKKYWNDMVHDYVSGLIDKSILKESLIRSIDRYWIPFE